MEFLFHSVYHDGRHTKYFNVYKVEANRFLAEPHHFNRTHEDEGDFELRKENDKWKTENDTFILQALYIGEEIDRFASRAIKEFSL